MRLEWALGYSTSIWERSITGGSCRQESLPPRNQDFPGAFSFPYLSRRGQVRVRFGKLLAILTPPSYHPLPQDVSHLGRVFPSSSSLPLCCIPRLSAVVSPSQQDWTDLVRADRLKAQDGHPLELLKRIKGRIDGAVPARKVEGQDTTPGPASVEQDFAGEEPEAVVEDLAGGESGPSAEDSPDGLAEQGTTRGLEHQVKIDQFQAFISRLSMEKSSESWICKKCTL